MITRPRRFGKTLTMSMVEHFLEEPDGVYPQFVSCYIQGESIS